MTTVKAPPSDTALAEPRAYARSSRRIQALAIDVLLHGTTLIALMSLLDLLGGQVPAAGAALGGWLGFTLFYEPVLVAWRGATLGHALSHLRVVDLESGRQPDLAHALIRFWLKATSGLVAFGFMAVTRRRQALHDLVAGTCVEEREP